MSTALEERVQRLEDIVGTLTGWIVSAQTGFGRQDYVAIERMIRESQEKYYGDMMREGLEEVP